MADDTFARRKFLVGAGLAGTAIAAGVAGPVEAQQPAPAAPAVAVAAPQAPEPFITLTAPEAAFIVAVVDTLIPADDSRPPAAIAVSRFSSTGSSAAPGAAAPKCIARVRF
jgi:gluconate 2-dehydrogenase gamma chain